MNDQTTAICPGPSATSARPDANRLLGLSLPLCVVLAERSMDVETILGISPGTIIEFDVPFDSELTLCVGNRPIAYGQAVKVGERFGLRITGIKTVRDRINALGP